MATNRNLVRAKAANDDEYYTRYEDIASHLSQNPSIFYNRRVLCPCADMGRAFHQYFSIHFRPFHLQSLTVTSFAGHGLFYDKNSIISFATSGSFTDIQLYYHTDITVTNPPYSLFHKFVLFHVYHGFPFIALGPLNATTYSGIVPYIMDNTIAVRDDATRYFLRPNHTYKKMASAVWWYYRIPPPPPKPLPFPLPSSNPYIDNTSIIFCMSLSDIHYHSPMAVPVTYLTRHNPDHFRILAHMNEPLVNGRRRFKRFIIERI